jgi:dolichol kinase
MDYGHVFRRLFHLCGPLVLAYYILPASIFWIPKNVWVLLTLGGLLVIEVCRLYSGSLFFGLREYEKGQISAYAWAGIGVTIAFFFFPPVFVICAVFGLCWTDPLIGEMRRRKKMRYYPAMPLSIYFLIVIGCLSVFSDIEIVPMIMLGIAGSVAAIAIEKPKFSIDDDFLMLIVPLIILTVFHEYLTITGLA